MSAHPNVILMAILTPDDLPLKTMRNILNDNKRAYEGEDDILIAEKSYHTFIGQDDDYQIYPKHEDLVFFDFVTYGYGVTITWDKLKQQEEDLEAWALETCKKHHCSYEIRVTANYW